MEYVEFALENLAWLLMSVAISVSALYSIHFLSSELLVASGDAISAMLSPLKLSHSDYARIRVDLPRLTLVSVSQSSGDAINIRVLLLNSTLKVAEAGVETVNGSIYVRN